nr:hypothetical protein GCM10025699_43760 [Microbacterium flavescens]
MSQADNRPAGAPAAGYDPDFLAARVPLPGTGGRRVRELPYEHFTVLLDPARRLAALTAVNIDGSSLVDLARGDDWHYDERVPEAEQCGPEVYARNDLDRGHLVRRRDPVWGPDADAARANLDTFSFTNAAPQAAGFNQSDELWLGLEDHVLAYAEAWRQRISVLTAPVLSPDDAPYRGIRIPRSFVKIAAWATPGAPCGQPVSCSTSRPSSTASSSRRPSPGRTRRAILRRSAPSAPTRCPSATSHGSPGSSSPSWPRPTPCRRSRPSNSPTASATAGSPSPTSTS